MSIESRGPTTLGDEMIARHPGACAKLTGVTKAPASRETAHRASLGVERRLAWRAALLLLPFACLVLGSLGTALGRGDHALVVEMEEVISPVTARFLARSVEAAERDGAEIVVVRLDTPGGLLTSTRDMVSAILNSPVPVAVYVAPGGAQAASAGTFIAAAGHFAVMAPATNIGAASPVTARGEDLPSTLSRKAFQDAAAFMRSIAELRGRNVEALEATVLDAAAYAAEEAVELGVVDFVVQDLGELLQRVDGMQVRVVTAEGERTVTLETASLDTRTVGFGLFDRLLAFVADPNVAFLLLSLGTIGLFIEFYTPGLIGPGIVGALFLVLAFVGLGNLSPSWAAVALIVSGGVLLFVETNVDGFGVFGIIGIASFVVGAVLLFAHFGTPTPTWPGRTISLLVLVPVTAAVTVGGGLLVYGTVRSRRERPVEVPHDLVGQVGRTTSAPNPEGTVVVHGETWRARLQGAGPQGVESIAEGTEVEVVELDGSTLVVRALEDHGADEP